MEKQPGWFAEVHFALEGRRLIVAELSVRSDARTAPAGGITAQLLRCVLKALPYGSAKGARPRGPQGERLTIRTRVGTSALFAALQGDPVQPTAHRRGRRPISTETLLAVAAAYARAATTGSTQPVVDAAKKLRMTPERVRDLVHRARWKKLLTPAQWGRSGGELTPQAARLIADAKKKGGRK